jgi:hypothetical protein
MPPHAAGGQQRRQRGAKKNSLPPGAQKHLTRMAFCLTNCSFGNLKIRFLHFSINMKTCGKNYGGVRIVNPFREN